jgi:hypothetical protein
MSKHGCIFIIHTFGRHCIEHAYTPDGEYASVYWMIRELWKGRALVSQFKDGHGFHHPNSSKLTVVSFLAKRTIRLINNKLD